MTEEKQELKPVFGIEDLRTLEVLTEPLRMRIDPPPADQVGAHGQGGGRRARATCHPAHYHVNMLADFGIIRVRGN